MAKGSARLVRPKRKTHRCPWCNGVVSPDPVEPQGVPVIYSHRRMGTFPGMFPFRSMTTMTCIMSTPARDRYV